MGTKYDPRLALRRDHEKFKRRRTKSVARWQRWDARLRGHNPVPSPGWPEALEAADHDATPSRQPEATDLNPGSAPPTAAGSPGPRD